jgi:hypothetical protein
MDIDEARVLLREVCNTQFKDKTFNYYIERDLAGDYAVEIATYIQCLRQQLTKPADEVLIEALRDCVLQLEYAAEYEGDPEAIKAKKKGEDALNAYKPADDTISVSKGEWEAMKKLLDNQDSSLSSTDTESNDD